MAQYLVDVFGDSLLIEPLKTHPCEENYPLPSPNDLKYKVLIKNKKIDPKPKIKNHNARKVCSITPTSSGSTGISTVSSSSTESCPTDSFRHRKALINEFNDNRRNAVLIDDDNSTDDDTPINDINLNEIQTSTKMRNSIYSSNIDTLPKATPTKAMSDLVHYVVPTRFKTFAFSEERNRSYEMSSFTESKAFNLIRECGKEFLCYNQRQISRIYPNGTRFESSNFNPYLFWPAGCQMAALNYQTLGKKTFTSQF
jgi:phosphatidylinositol phospholipase C beta